MIAVGAILVASACGGETSSLAPLSPASARESTPVELPPGCDAWNGQPVEAACIPRSAREGVPLLFEAVAACGACGARAETCSVVREGRTLVLSLDGANCMPEPGASCTSTCTKKRLPCRIPPLEGGRYVIRWNDPGGRVDSLDVVPDGTARTACVLGAE